MRENAHFVKSDYGVERKDIYSILRLNRRAKVLKIAVFGNGKLNFVKMLVETKILPYIFSEKAPKDQLSC